MKITFPDFGYAGLVASKLMTELNIDYVKPVKKHMCILKKGVLLSPEEMCLPFKYMLGSFVEAYDRGADTVVMMATSGPCRLGEYAQLFKDILDKNGYCFRWILIDSPAAVGIKEFFYRVDMVLGNSSCSRRKQAASLIKAVMLVHRLETFKKELLKRNGYFKNSFEGVKILRETERLLDRAKDIDDCREVLKRAERKLKHVECDRERKPVKICITGEIYTCMEDEVNGRLTEKLMRSGCSVKCSVSLWWWMKHIICSGIRERFLPEFHNSKGLCCNVGGYSRETIDAILEAESFDGVIKIMPSGCMPEIVAKSVCDEIEEKKHRKILHLIFDETSGQAGYDTRVEAFVDMLERRRDVLAGSRYRIHKYGSGFNR